MKWILLIIVLTEALYEGLYDRGNKENPPKWKGFNLFKSISKFVQCLFIVAFFYFAYTISKHNWRYEYIAIYLLFRVSLFNYIYALASGGKLFGNCLIDRITYILVGRSLWFYIVITCVLLIIALGL